ncbi:hypothetical protein CHS0354_008452 [Potamilus streckersoni]|uniref:Uncharacterized protein n=1 Tax=Potamilus streckersoni TaxID=2493646 RepID=A0AAE0RPQ8_9BIVA|nr:hypothetical protein CHS0354_008452 [Potamilus streckersoni]
MGEKRRKETDTGVNARRIFAPIAGTTITDPKANPSRRLSQLYKLTTAEVILIARQNQATFLEATVKEDLQMSPTNEKQEEVAEVEKEGETDQDDTLKKIILGNWIKVSEHKKQIYSLDLSNVSPGEFQIPTSQFHSNGTSRSGYSLNTIIMSTKNYTLNGLIDAETYKEFHDRIRHEPRTAKKVKEAEDRLRTFN